MNYMQMIESQQYDEVVELLLKQNSLQSLNTLYDLIHPKYKKLKLKINESINPAQNEQELLLQCQLRYKHLNTLLQYGMYHESIIMINKLKTEIPPQYKALHYYLDLFKQMVQKNVSEAIHDKEQQIESFKQLLKDQEESNYLNQEGLFAYLLPVQWLNRWKAYVGLEYEKIDQPDPLNNTNGIKLLHQNFDIYLDDQIEEEELPTQPGPINGTTLINIIPNLWIDQQPNKKYQNYLLKQNLQEGVDYIYVSHKIYYYFESLYGGFQVKRQIIENAQGKLVIDMIPRLLTAFVINQKDPKQSYFLQFSVSAKENFEVISRKIQTKYDYQWLKFQDITIQNEWFQNFNSGTIVQSIQTASIDIQAFEEINFIDEEIYIYEEKMGKKFYFNEIKEQLQQNNQQQINLLMDKFNICDVPQMIANSRKGLVGLQNLGNTCFMNAAIQCLQNTYELTQFMILNQFVNDLNTTNPLGTQGKIATAYSQLLKQMYYGTNQTVSPSQLKNIIGRFAQQFVGYGQQDSQELLSFLLDGLHEDLNKVKNKPIIMTIEITNETDEEASFKFWSNHLLRNRSIIVDLMAGQYKSTLVCPKCKRISKTFDPFLSLSLPIPHKQPISVNLYFVFMDVEQIPLKINLQLFQDSDALELKKSISQITKVDEQRMNLLLIKDSKLRERVDNNKTCEWINQHEGILFVQEVDINFQSLTPDYRSVNYVFTQKQTKIYEQEKALSFARDIVLTRNTTIYDMYSHIYLRFRPYFLLIVSLLDIRDKDSIIQKQKIINLDEIKEEIQFLQKQARLPFQLRLQGTNKLLEYDDMNTLSSFPQSITVEVLLDDYMKNYFSQLKLQRCKDHPQSTNNTRRSNQHSLEDCLKLFTREEILGEGDEWYCNKCKLHVRASKKMEIYKAPKILIIHLKRFKTNKIHNFGNIYFSGQAQKISTFVQFPIDQLNLNEYVLTKQKGDETNYTYQLYAVDNHFGGTGGGHYTAFGLNPIINKWVEFDDSSVRYGTRDVVSESAYILFYRRLDAIPCIIPK
ncbi:hypothetical protein pb186bvf_020089 [Paramecium bursaria]